MVLDFIFHKYYYEKSLPLRGGFSLKIILKKNIVKSTKFWFAAVQITTYIHGQKQFSEQKYISMKKWKAYHLPAAVVRF